MRGVHAAFEEAQVAVLEVTEAGALARGGLYGGLEMFFSCGLGVLEVRDSKMCTY